MPPDVNVFLLVVGAIGFYCALAALVMFGLHLLARIGNERDEPVACVLDREQESP
jgi:hypothetical protein